MVKPFFSAIAQKGIGLARRRVLGMSEGDRSKVFVFVHVPKCAGSTLLPLFTSHFHPAEMFTNVSPAKDVALSEVLTDKVKCYCAHVSMDLDSVPANFVCVSVMRDPVKRIISHYHYVKRTPEHFLYREVTEKGYSLLDYALGDFNNAEFDNGQLRQLAGVPADTIIDEAVFGAARRKISQIYSVIGMTEKLDDFVGAVSDLMGWKRPTQYANKNVGEYEAKGNTPPDVVLAIRERNKWDQRLYEEFAVGGALAAPGKAQAS